MLVSIVRSALISLGILVLGLVALVVVYDVPLNDPLWWVANENPPRVTIDGPSGAQRGTVQATIGLEPAGRARVVSVRVDDQPRSASDGRIAVDSASLRDGPHRVEVVAHDTSRRQNLTSAVWTFVSDNTPPKLEADLDPFEGPLEGHTLVVRVRADEPLSDVRGTIGGRPLRLEPDANGSLWALEGFPPDPPETTFGLRLAASDAVGNPAELEREWPVRRTTFPEDDLQMEPSQADVEAHVAEDRQLDQIYRRPGGARQWDGVFRAPVAGEVSTAFGTRRSYEYHPGMDFAAAQGAPVVAPANGVVAFVGTVPARGNIVILDHGAGVYSTYAHLLQADVKEGETVKPGQTIAQVGTTGFSTGPHLHWEIWVGGANVDPQEWTRRNFP
jgi:murein DD-endopeptidase MepM/ murein hydrolase activator NlpD